MMELLLPWVIALTSDGYDTVFDTHARITGKDDHMPEAPNTTSTYRPVASVMPALIAKQMTPMIAGQEM